MSIQATAKQTYPAGPSGFSSPPRSPDPDQAAAPPIQPALSPPQHANQAKALELFLNNLEQFIQHNLFPFSTPVQPLCTFFQNNHQDLLTFDPKTATYQLQNHTLSTHPDLPDEFKNSLVQKGPNQEETAEKQSNLFCITQLALKGTPLSEAENTATKQGTPPNGLSLMVYHKNGTNPHIVGRDDIPFSLYAERLNSIQENGTLKKFTFSQGRQDVRENNAGKSGDCYHCRLNDRAPLVVAFKNNLTQEPEPTQALTKGEFLSFCEAFFEATLNKKNKNLSDIIKVATRNTPTCKTLFSGIGRFKLHPILFTDVASPKTLSKQTFILELKRTLKEENIDIPDLDEADLAKYTPPKGTSKRNTQFYVSMPAKPPQNKRAKSTPQAAHAPSVASPSSKAIPLPSSDTDGAASSEEQGHVAKQTTITDQTTTSTSPEGTVVHTTMRTVHTTTEFSAQPKPPLPSSSASTSGASDPPLSSKAAGKRKAAPKQESEQSKKETNPSEQKAPKRKSQQQLIRQYGSSSLTESEAMRIALMASVEPDTKAPPAKKGKHSAALPAQTADRLSGSKPLPSATEAAHLLLGLTITRPVTSETAGSSSMAPEQTSVAPSEMETSVTTTQSDAIRQILRDKQEIKRIIDHVNQGSIDTLNPNQIRALLFIVGDSWVYNLESSDFQFNNENPYFETEDEDDFFYSVVDYLSRSDLSTLFNIQDKLSFMITNQLKSKITFEDKMATLRLLAYTKEFEDILGFTPNLNFMLAIAKRVAPITVLKKDGTASEKQTFQHVFVSEMIRHIHLLDVDNSFFDRKHKVTIIKTCFDLITDSQLKLTLLTNITPTGLTLYNQALSDGHYVLADYLQRLEQFIRTQQIPSLDTTSVSPAVCTIYTHNPNEKRKEPAKTPEPFVRNQRCQHHRCQSDKPMRSTGGLRKHYARDHLEDYIQFQLACYARFQELPFEKPYSIDDVINIFTSSIYYNPDSGLFEYDEKNTHFKTIADFEVCLHAFIDLHPSWTNLNYFMKDDSHYRYEIKEAFLKSQTFQEKLTCLKLLALDPRPIVNTYKYPLNYMLEAMDYLDPIIHLQKNWTNTEIEKSQLKATLEKEKKFEHTKLIDGPRLMKTHIYVAMQLGQYELINFIICNDIENFKREINTDMFIDVLSILASHNKVELIKLIFDNIEDSNKKIELLDKKDRDGKTLINIALSKPDQTLFNFLTNLKVSLTTQQQGSASNAIVSDNAAASSGQAPSNPQAGSSEKPIDSNDDDKDRGDDTGDGNYTLDLLEFLGL